MVTKNDIRLPGHLNLGDKVRFSALRELRVLVLVLVSLLLVLYDDFLLEIRDRRLLLIDLLKLILLNLYRS
jgi:hypothetical protein